MGVFAGMIAGAMGGGAQAVGQIADNQIQKQTRMDLASFESQLQMDRAAQLARLQQTMAREDQTYNTVGAGADEKLKFVGRETGVLAEREREVGKARGDVERSNLAAYSTDPAARAGVRARTSDSESGSAKTGAAATSYDLEQKKKLQRLIDEYESPTTPEPRRAQLEKQLTLRGVLKAPANEYDLVKVTEEKPTSGGGTRKEERTERRKPDSAARTVMPPPAAVEALRLNPSRKDEFDAKYGKGSADQYLKQTTK